MCLDVPTAVAVSLLGGVLLAVGQHHLLNLQGGAEQMHTLRKVLLLRRWYIEVLQSSFMRAVLWRDTTWPSPLSWLVSGAGTWPDPKKP